MTAARQQTMRPVWTAWSLFGPRCALDRTSQPIESRGRVQARVGAVLYLDVLCLFCSGECVVDSMVGECRVKTRAVADRNRVQHSFEI